MSRDPDLELRQWWRELVDSFDPQRQTVKQFCKQNEISVASFYRWRNRFAGATLPSFVPVEVRPTGQGVQTACQDTDANDMDGNRTAAVIRLGRNTVIELAEGQADLITGIAVALATLQQERQVSQ